MKQRCFSTRNINGLRLSNDLGGDFTVSPQYLV